MTFVTPQNESSPQGAASHERVTLGQAVGRAAGLLKSGALSSGDRAEVRRFSSKAPFAPAVWKMMVHLEDEGAPIRFGNVIDERRWATLLMAMAHCIDLHDYRTPLGKALAEAGWSKLRFVQLMRATDTKLEIQVRRLAQYLTQKNMKANWSDVAKLLFLQSGDPGVETRLRIARTYYRTLYAKEQNN